MNIEQIKSLLSRFYEGQTTPEEEQQLVAFFRREDVPEDLQQDKQLFLLLAQTSEQEMPQDISDEITAFVNNLGQQDIQPLTHVSQQRKGVIYRLKTPPKDKEFNVPEVGTSVTRAPHLLRPQATGFRSVRLNRFWYRVAATVAILLAIGGGVLHHQRTYATDPFRDTCATPEEAAAQIQRANRMITKATEQCMVPTSKALQQADAAKQVINQYINF